MGRSLGRSIRGSGDDGTCLVIGGDRRKRTRREQIGCCRWYVFSSSVMIRLLALLPEELFRCRHHVLLGTSLAAFRQLPTVGGSLVEAHDRLCVLIEVVALQPSNHDEDALWFQLKELTAGDAIKVDPLFRCSFDQQSADDGKMCEEPFHLGLPSLPV
jgi:hypothetical protein